MKDPEFQDKAKKFVDTEYRTTTVKEYVGDDPHILIYMVPASLDRTIYSIDQIEKNKLRPICGSNYVHESQSFIIAIGTPFGARPGCSTELKENGVIEAADITILDNNKIFSSFIFKEKILTSMKEYLNILIDDLKVETPIFFSLTLNGVEGYKLDETDKIMHKNNPVYSNIINNKSEIDNLLNGLFDIIIRGFTKNLH